MGYVCVFVDILMCSFSCFLIRKLSFPFIQLSVDTDLIDYGTQVIGETLKKTIVLTNKGAQGISFSPVYNLLQSE